MAGNPIDLVVTTDALKGLSDLIARLEAADKALLSTVDSAAKLNKAVGTITTPQGLNANSSDNAQVLADLQKQQAEITKLHDTIAKKAEQSRLAEIKLQQAREKAFDSFEKNSAREQALLDKSANTYNKTQAQISKLTQVYNDLAARKARYNDLSENEEKRLNTLQAVTTKYNTTLKDVDATIGKHTRNVGNYASGWNGLGNSINQLTREMPAFANSMQTGFMAISNNLPTLFDEINNLKKANVELAASGEPTKSIFKQLAGAMFSWGTALSVGVTLLTVYGKDIVEFIGNLFQTKKTIDSTKLAQEGLNKAFEEGSVQEAVKNVNELTTNIDLAKKGILNKEDVVKQYNETIGTTTGLVTSLDEAEKELTKNGDAYIKMMLYKAAANLALEEAANQALKAEQDRLKKSEEFSSTTEDIFSTIGRGAGGGQGVDIQAENKARQKRNIARKNAAIKEAEELAKVQENIAKTFQEKAGKIAGDMKFDFFGGNSKKDEEAAAKARLKAEEDRLKALAELRKKEIELELANIDLSLNNTEKYYTERLYYLQQDFLKRNELAQINYEEELRLAKGNQTKEKTALINFQLEKLKLLDDYNKKAESISKLELKPAGFAKSKDEKDPMKQLAESAKLAENALEGTAKQMEKNRAIMQQMKLVTDQWLSSFSTEFLQKSGLGSLQTFFDGTFNTLMQGAENSQEKFAVAFNAISESVQEAFNMISNYSQANFDAEYARLESQKDIAISFAGDSASAKKKIEEDFDKKKREIANREAKAKKKQAMFNIAIDTAQAAIGSLRIDPTGIMAIVISAMGALQLGLVAAQKIPQYWKGTDYAQSGLAWTNEKGAEIHTDKYGNIKSLGDNNGARLTMMEQGDKVYTASESQRMLQDKMLNDMLIDRGISMNYNSNNTGLTYAQMKEIMNETLGNKPEKNIIFDKNGFSTYIRKSGNITRYTNQRASGVGMTV